MQLSATLPEASRAAVERARCSQGCCRGLDEALTALITSPDNLGLQESEADAAKREALTARAQSLRVAAIDLDSLQLAGATSAPCRPACFVGW